MGYITELNTLLRPHVTFDFTSLVIGKTHTTTIDRERTFPLHIAILLVDNAWNFYGYAVVEKITNWEKKAELTFRMLTLFSEDEKRLYKEKFLEAAQLTGEA